MGVEERRRDELLEQLSIVQVRLIRKHKILEQAQQRSTE